MGLPSLPALAVLCDPQALGKIPVATLHSSVMPERGFRSSFETELMNNTAIEI